MTVAWVVWLFGAALLAAIVALWVINRRLARALRDQEHALQRLEQTLRQTRSAPAQQRELERLKSTFVASMSHELRTPLNAIIGFTGVLLEGMSGDLNAAQRDQLGRAYRAAKHLLELINDVIDLAKIEAGRMELTPRRFALREAVDTALATLRPLIAAKNLRLQLELADGLCLYGDPKRVQQCIYNVLSNAVKYTEHGDVRVEARSLGNSVEIAVSVTDIGIEAEQLQQLFQPFERLDSSLKVKSGGTGLGLYLTAKLLRELLQGDISVTSEIGRGSCFRLRLPVRLNEA